MCRSGQVAVWLSLSKPAPRTASGVLQAGAMVVAVTDQLAGVRVWPRVTLNPAMDAYDFCTPALPVCVVSVLGVQGPAEAGGADTSLTRLVL